ncbi:MAG: phosphoenolpyruvate--protein phosphotransferase [Lentisphaeria bacterium]|nr:phosphoenolpyruvate--protein phosphotransferase [Lentisphaeria bacterium]
MDKKSSERLAAGGREVGYLEGTAIVLGVCYGQCMILAGDDALMNVTIEKVNDIEAEKRRFAEAVENVRNQLKNATKEVQDVLAETDEGIFDMYESLLDDPSLHEKVNSFLDESMSLPSALCMAARSFQSSFQHIQDTYIRERILDVKDVLIRLMDDVRNAEPADDQEAIDSTMPVVLVARELFPSQFLSAPLRRVCGIICETGGATSHAAILARALRIPMMVNLHDIQNIVSAHDKVLVDCRAGLCFPRPSARLIKQYQLALNISRRSRQAPLGVLQAQVDDHPATMDGTALQLRGNITLFSELPAMHSVGIREIGLYRTEFMFLIRNSIPDEDTQYRVLKRLVDGADGAPIVIRALDIGGDKSLPYIQWGSELNPSLGWRGLRFLLTNPEIAHTHLRAILRNCVNSNVRLMFPMISDMSDIISIKALVKEAKDSLAAEGVPYGSPKIGMMVELPSAVLALESLLPEVDFVSIGTNDLVQYFFAVDRGNSRVTKWFQQCHPLVFKILHFICTTVAKFPGKDLEICGELAGNISALPALIGAGLRTFSMNPASIPNVRDYIRKLRLDDCEELYQRVSEANTAEQAQQILDDFAESMR